MFFQKNVLIFALIFVIAFLTYAPFLYTPFLNDDTQWLSIIEEKHHSSFYYLKVFSFYENASFERFYTPLSLLVFDIFSRLSHNDPFFMRVFCICIHALNACLIFLILSQWFTLKQFTSFLGAVLFTVNALQSQTIIWICNLHDSLGVLFLLLLLYIYFFVHFKHTITQYIICILLIIAGLCSKESFIISPYILIFLDRAVFRSKKAGVHITFASITIIYVIARFYGYGGIGGYDENGLSFISLFHCIELIYKYMLYLFIPCYRKYTLLIYLFIAVHCLLLFNQKNIISRAKLIICSILFVFPLFFTKNDLLSRYFYAMTPFYIFSLCIYSGDRYIKFRSKTLLAKTALVLLIFLNIFMLSHEIPVYKKCSDIVWKTNSFLNTAYKKVFLINVPYQLVIFNKPLAMRYYPAAEIHNDHIQQQKSPIHQLSFVNFGDIVHTENNWIYDTKTKFLNFNREYVHFNRTFYDLKEKESGFNIEKYLKKNYKIYAFDKHSLQYKELK